MAQLIDLNSATLNISATTTSARGPIPLQGASTVRLVNPGAAQAYWRSGDATVAATTNDLQMSTGVESFSINPNHTHLAVILASGAVTVSANFSNGGE